MEDSKGVVTRHIEAIAGRDRRAQYALTHSSWRIHLPGADEPIDRAVLFERNEDLFEAVPDLKATVHQQVAEGKFVATRLHWQGTHAGATGEPVSFDLIRVDRVENGLLSETWAQYDRLALESQLGE